MWITAWILAASATLNQPTYPPFYTQAECETVRKVYGRGWPEHSSQCLQVRIWANR